MSELINIRNKIQQGAPSNGDEARKIIEIALQDVTGHADWAQRLSAALTEILVGRQLHAETYKARADALAVIDEIGEHAPHG